MRRIITVLLLAIGMLCASPANATSRPIVITDAVNIRPGPNTDAAPLTTMPAGAHPGYICYADGQNVGGTTKWFRVSWQGIVGYYSSIADDVPLSAQSNIEGNYGIPRCGTGADINQGLGDGLSLDPAPTVFNRDATVGWTLEHAQDVRPFERLRFSDCTWLISQALWYGGFHETAGWNSYTNHGNKLLPIPGTVSATAARELYAYLLANVPVQKITLEGDKEFSTNAVPEARPGDVIFYDWGHGEGISHAAMVVNIAPGQYPEVAEWGVNPIRTPYVKRGWTYSAKEHEWLQVDNPNMIAYLFHFTVRND